jgi:chorismate lyase / 3-hydroxybenzoate synthase
MQKSSRKPAPAAAASPFEVTYVTAAQAGALLDDKRHLLAAIHYSIDATYATPEAGHIAVPLAPLGPAFIETWRSREPVVRGALDNILFSRTPDVLVGQLCLAEQPYGDLETATFEAYRRIYTCTQAQGYPHLLRVWNFYPDINRHEGALERYQAFCQGRHRALEMLQAQASRLPAASAIGTVDGDLQIYFLAAREPGEQVENPRQVSAFCYPPRYSPKSPSFSRAVIKRWGASTHLYISGTASIVGHETRHISDTRAQLDETLNNLEFLIRHTAARHSLGISAVRDLSALKIYVRDPADGDAIAARIRDALGGELPVLLLRGDICRANLRLEIEGLYTGQGAA